MDSVQQKDTSAIIMTGASGNTGLKVLHKLRMRYPEKRIVCLVRSTSQIENLRTYNVEIVVCDLVDSATYKNYIRPNDIFLEIANLRYARVMLPELEKLGVKRAFCVTTTGVFSKYHSYSSLYNEIEADIRGSSIVTTIIRPSMIYGNEHDHNMHKLLRIVNKIPVYPIFGDGKALMQPVHVDDLAEGIVQAVSKNAIGEFNLAGPQAHTYRQIVEYAFEACERRGLLLFIPVKPVAFIVGLLQRMPRFPIKKEQVLRLQEDKSFDIRNSQRRLDYKPRRFENGIKQEVNHLREIGKI